MSTRLSVWILFFVAIGLTRTVCAQAARHKIVVTILAVKESDWQREASTTTSQAGLRERQHTHRLCACTPGSIVSLDPREPAARDY